MARANLHKGIAKREAGRFFNRQSHPTFRIDPEGDQQPSAHIGAINRCLLVAHSAPPDLPASFAARFGDAIHNYRCALDHVAWQLVLHGARWPLPDERTERQVQFPIYDTAASFRKEKGRRLPGVERSAVNFIEARHNYVRGKATNDALMALADLSNNDKHRTLHLFASVFRTLKSEVTFERCEPLSWENPTGKLPPLKAGTVLARFSYRVIGLDHKVGMNLTPQVQIVIEDGRDFSEMLEGIAVEVRQILTAAEIVAAVT